MKNKSIIFIGIIIAILCCTQFSDFENEWNPKEKLGGYYIQKHHIKSSVFEKRNPLKHMVYIVTKKITINL